MGEVVVEVDHEIKWIKHYSICHKILLVGEGDFSFAACLAKAFATASNIVATSLDSKGFFLVSHQNLVKGFLRSARDMLQENGEVRLVHVTHKTAHPFNRWEIEKVAEVGLRLVDKVLFYIWDYPDFENKRGDGSRCNESFPVGDCCTFKFSRA
ncbi:hypothetical protein Q3G72_005597 [Acer saccharum]|nr:hypothetical protein Q3G72_005597 [Acer saccharum]